MPGEAGIGMIDRKGSGADSPRSSTKTRLRSTCTPMLCVCTPSLNQQRGTEAGGDGPRGKELGRGMPRREARATFDSWS